MRGSRLIFSAVATAAIAVPAPAGAATLPSIPSPSYVTDGQVSAIARTASTIYLGGEFTHVGPRTGSFALISTSSGKANLTLPQVSGGDGQVDATAPDGTGGYYIGGNFSEVGGLPRNDAAHILANGTLDPAWNPNLSGTVDAIAVSGSTVYLGGQFSGADAVNGTLTRNHAAAVDAHSGVATSWDPNFDGSVDALVVSGQTVYAGGGFSTVNGGATAAARIAAVSAADGSALPFSAAASGGVVESLALSPDGSTLYLGGHFHGATGLDGAARNYVGAVNASNGNLVTGFDANADDDVRSLAFSPDGGTLYLGGDFSDVNGSTERDGLAAVDPSTGTASAWDPKPNGTVDAIAVSADGQTVYAGGDFTGADAIGGAARSHLAAVDATTGTATGWDPELNHEVDAIALVGSTVAAGGQFTSAGIVERNHLASLDVATGAVTAWDPNVSGDVTALLLSSDQQTLYIGGDFSGASAVNGNRTRFYAAAVDASSGKATSWDPSPDGQIYALALSPDGNTVYLGGEFDNLNGNVPRVGAGAVDATTGKVTPFDPDVGPIVYALALSPDGTTVYAGGEFSDVSPTMTARSNAAAFNATTGAVTSWDPNVNGYVHAIVASPDGKTVYLGGGFGLINGSVDRNNVAAVDAGAGTATPWNPNAANTVWALALSPDAQTVYLGGDSSGSQSINGNTRRQHLAAVDAGSGTATAWDPEPNGTVYALSVDPAGDVTAGGTFTSLQAAPQEGVAVFDIPVTTPPPPPPPGTVAPVLRAFAQSHRVWRAGTALATIARSGRRHHKRRAPVGTRFTFNVSEPSQVTLTFTRRFSGRRLKNGHCVAPGRHDRHRPRCSKAIPSGSLSLSAAAGARSIAFDGRLSASSRLSPGSYRVTIAAVNTAGQRSASSTLAFTIVK